MIFNIDDDIIRMINIIADKLDDEGYDYSRLQVLNIAKELCNYDINDMEEFLICVEYASKLRASILFYLNHVYKYGDDPKFYRYKNVSYAVKRTLNTYRNHSYNKSNIPFKKLESEADMVMWNMIIEPQLEEREKNLGRH